MVKPASREHPILFTADNVRLIINGKKWETRRPVKPEPKWTSVPDSWTWSPRRGLHLGLDDAVAHCPYGRVGDVLWVRETWRTEELPVCHTDGIRFAADNAFVPIENTEAAADLWVDAHRNGKHEDKWRPNIHMPKWACRLRLRLHDVKIERLGAITEVGAQAEGMRDIAEYRKQWTTLHGRKSWTANPYVWVLKFARLEPHR